MRQRQIDTVDCSCQHIRLTGTRIMIALYCVAVYPSLMRSAREKKNIFLPSTSRASRLYYCNVCSRSACYFSIKPFSVAPSNQASWRGKGQCPPILVDIVQSRRLSGDHAAAAHNGKLQYYSRYDRRSTEGRPARPSSEL